MKRFSFTSTAGIYQFKAPWKASRHGNYCTEEARAYLEDFEGTEFMAVQALTEAEAEAVEEWKRHGYVLELVEVLAPKSVQLTDEQVEALIDKLNEAAQWVEEYNTENEDCPTADYCTWGWKEGDIGELVKRAKDRSNDDELIAGVEALEDRGTDEDKIAELLVDASDLQFEDSYYSCSNEIFSMQVGEVEDQLPDEIFHEFGFDSFEQVNWTEEQKKEIERRANCTTRYLFSGGDCIHVDCGYGRWYLKVDTERFLEAAGLETIADEEARSMGRLQGREIGAAQEIDFKLPESEAEDRFMEACSEADDSYRQYSPFEFLAKRFNQAVNSEEAWSAFDEGLTEGFRAAWKERTEGEAFNTADEDDDEGEDQ